MKRAGLRTRVVGGFAAGALLLSASMALVSYQVTRGFLLDGRERASIRAAQFDARVVQEGLAAEPADIRELLRSLDTGNSRRVMVRRDGQWFTRTADVGVTAAVPQRLREMVDGGRQAVQRVRVGGVPALVVGIPLSSGTALYEVDEFRELDQALQILWWVLAVVAAATAIAGAGLGWYAARYVLRPLRSVADTAQRIAGGDMGSRLDPAVEPDLARLTTSFNDMVDRLAEQAQRDRRFASDVSHELRSPLQTLLAAASVLDNRKARLDERTATAAGLVVAEVDRFQSLVEDLMELARSDQPADSEPVDVAELARRACRVRKLPEDLVLTADGDDQERWCVDRRRIEQMLGNLLDNAMRYGGGPTAVRIDRSGDTGRIEVDDEGPGVPPTDKAVIFDRFVRGRAARARGQDGGTGLGLALVAQHAAAHGGRATVLDRPGGGARFRVELRVELPVECPSTTPSETPKEVR
jgi:two-component system, OmpR family, sensor histidine kinase MtrB